MHVSYLKLTTPQQWPFWSWQAKGRSVLFLNAVYRYIASPNHFCLIIVNIIIFNFPFIKNRKFHQCCQTLSKRGDKKCFSVSIDATMKEQINNFPLKDTSFQLSLKRNEWWYSQQYLMNSDSKEREWHGSARSFDLTLKKRRRLPRSFENNSIFTINP